MLCQSFIRLFLSWKSVISLEEAARKVADVVDFDDNKLKTKVRRLYDIANVLGSLRLIEKTFQKKRGYRWIGERGIDLF